MRSPLNLYQEIFADDPWKILVVSILFNRTARPQVSSMIHDLFYSWSDAKAMSNADQEKLERMVHPLGFGHKRSEILIRFSREYQGPWKDPIELYGIGKYGQDSYRIFWLKDYSVEPTDEKLKAYLEWRKHEKDQCS